MVVGGQNGFRVPGWFLALVGAVAAVVVATVAILNDRAAAMERLHTVQVRQCAVVRYLARTDSLFSSPVFQEGCP